MAKTVLIESKPSITKVGAEGTPLETYTQTTYEVDNNGKLVPGSAKSYIAYNNSTVPGVKNFIRAAESKDGGATWKYENYLDGTPVFGAAAQKSLKEGALKTTTQQQITTSAKKAAQPLPKEDQKKLAVSTINQATTSDEATQNREGVEKELKEIKQRENYDRTVTYPEKLQLEYQDCIKFSMLRYQQSFLNATNRRQLGELSRSVTVQEGTPRIGTRDILTTIVLPIPGGISDSNPVDWQGNALDEIIRAFANIAQSGITKGGTGLSNAAGNEAENVKSNVEGFQQLGAAKFTQIATDASGIMQRQYGAITNPNLELLFNGPSLRTFSFTFKLSPRSESEAIIVKKIIRYFKQGMTPKRSSGYLLLQSPNTFAISYLSSNKQHPYLNRFKECALTQCDVDYTPDGNYMSYDGAERSMTSYELRLQFQELVPLFDDDYGNKDDNIGF